MGALPGTEDVPLGLLSVFIRKGCRIFLGVFLFMVEMVMRFLGLLQYTTQGDKAAESALRSLAPPCAVQSFPVRWGRSNCVLWVGKLIILF